MFSKKLGFSLVILLVLGVSILGQDPAYDLRDLVGSRASSGENQLRNRGYYFVKSQKGRDRVWSNWWNDNGRVCVTVVTMNGRFDSIVTSPPGDCNRDSNDNRDDSGRQGVTVYSDRDFRGASQSFGVGRFLNAGGQLGAIRNDDASSVVVERGFRVRLCDSEGSMGVGSGRCEEYGEGRYNLRYNDKTSFLEVTRTGRRGGGRGNYREVDVSDLVGSRASSGESAMRSRGFRNVDSFSSGSARYTIWWRSGSRQCIQVATVDGRYDSVTDIHSHPKCH